MKETSLKEGKSLTSSNVILKAKPLNKMYWRKKITPSVVLVKRTGEKVATPILRSKKIDEKTVKEKKEVIEKIEELSFINKTNNEEIIENN